MECPRLIEISPRLRGSEPRNALYWKNDGLTSKAARWKLLQGGVGTALNYHNIHNTERHCSATLKGRLDSKNTCLRPVRRYRHDESESHRIISEKLIKINLQTMEHFCTDRVCKPGEDFLCRQDDGNGGFSSHWAGTGYRNEGKQVSSLGRCFIVLSKILTKSVAKLNQMFAPGRTMGKKMFAEAFRSIKWNIIELKIWLHKS